MRRNLVAIAVMMLAALPAQATISVSSTRIAHGVEAWYAADTSVPVVDILLTFEGAGAVSDPAGKEGRAALAAASLTEGAGTLDSGAFQRALAEDAITLDISSDSDRLQVHVRCLRDRAPKAAALLLAALTQPTLAEPDLARMRAALQSMLLQLEERPAYRTNRLLETRLFQGHPYSNPDYGTKAGLDALTAQDLREYLAMYVTRGNLTIAAAGDVDSGLLSDMLTPLVSALKANEAGPVAVTRTTAQGAGEVLRSAASVPQTVIRFAAPGLARSDPRFYELYLLNHVLGGSALTSRLGDELRQKKGLVYSVSTGLDVRPGAALITGSLASSNGTADAALSELKTVLSTIASKGITSEECADAKSYVLGRLPLQLDNSAAISGMISVMQLENLGEDYLERRAEYFTEVSCSAVSDLARELLAPERFTIAIIGGTAAESGPTPTAAPVVPSGNLR